MKKVDIRNVKYELISCAIKGYKQVQVIYEYKGDNHKYFIFVKEGENVNYINEAKRIFEKDLELGEVVKITKSNHKPWLIAATSVLSVAAITFAALFTWKMLQPGGEVQPEPSPEVDESVSTIEYNYSPYLDDDKSTVKIYFDTDETIDEEDPPFTGDVYVQWNEDDPNSKVKVQPNAKDITFNYKEAYPNIDARTFTITLYGDVKRFATTASGAIEVIPGNSLITSINVGETVTTIPSFAFSGNFNLTSVHIAGNVKKIQKRAFYDCSRLTSVTFSTNNETDSLDIGEYAFINCNKLRTIHFPKRLRYFSPIHSRSLEQITIPKDNPYYTNLHEYDGEVEDCGLLVTKQDIPNPDNPSEIVYQKDGVVAAYNRSTYYSYFTNFDLYDGIKHIYSLSGLDIDSLIIPPSVEDINTLELHLCRIESVGVLEGNEHYTDLYQELDPEYMPITANVLAELHDDGGEKTLSIIKVANEADPIEETGAIYIDGVKTDVPVTEFALGAALNSTITSLDLPATIEKVNFDNEFYSAINFTIEFINPFTDFSDDIDYHFKSLTIRSLTPPQYTGESPNIAYVINSQENSITISVPEETVDAYSFDRSIDDQPGFWNYSNFSGYLTAYGPRYAPIDSIAFNSSDEASVWVKNNYFGGSREALGYSKWDLSSLIKIKQLGSDYGTLYDKLKSKLKDICDNPFEYYLTLFNPRFAASALQKYDFCNVDALSNYNFDYYFEPYIVDEGSNSDFAFSVNNHCLEAIQCPNFVSFELESFSPDYHLSGHIKRIFRFNELGYPSFHRFEINNFSIQFGEEDPIQLDDIYFENNFIYNLTDFSTARDWAGERQGNTANVDSRSLNWSFAYFKSAEFDYGDEITVSDHEQDYNGIKGFITDKAGSDVTVQDLIAEKDVESTLADPVQVNAVTPDEVTSGQNGMCGFTDDGHLCVYDMIYPEGVSSRFSGNPLSRLRLFNNDGVCDYEAYYFLNSKVKDQSNDFSGYLEITNHFVEE